MISQQRFKGQTGRSLNLPKRPRGFGLRQCSDPYWDLRRKFEFRKNARPHPALSPRRGGGRRPTLHSLPIQVAVDATLRFVSETLRPSNAFILATRGRTIHPLLGGEGRGEGERIVHNSHAAVGESRTDPGVATVISNNSVINTVSAHYSSGQAGRLTCFSTLGRARHGRALRRCARRL